MFGGPSVLLRPFGTLQTLRSPSAVCVASISVFCLDEDPCHARPVMRDGGLFVVKVCSIVKEGRRVAIRMEPLRYPIAKVRQSVDGARAVTGSKIVRAEICSEVEGSKRMMFPCSLPKAMLPLRKNAATLMVS